MVLNCSFADGKFTGDAAASPSVNHHNQSFLVNPPTNFHSPLVAVAPLSFTPSHSMNHTTLNFTPSNQAAMLSPSSRQFTTPHNQSFHQQQRQQHYHQSPFLASPRRSPIVGTVKTPVNVRLRSIVGGDRHTPRQHISQSTIFSLVSVIGLVSFL